jgi:dTDP-4-amino-4,6-dideoxygalactose transaminase
MANLALCGGTPTVTTRPPKYPSFSADVFERIEDELTNGPTQGLSKEHPIINELETSLANYHGVKHCLAASSGHGALQTALIGLEITDGDEVLTSAYSWGASVSCILHNGAVPAFVDVSAETGLMEPDLTEAGVTERTRAILIPHLYGQPVDMTGMMALAERHGLVVIEDGSQAHGARHRGTRVGAFGDASAFSTNGVKPLATTEGGYMVTPRDDVYWNPMISCQHAGRGDISGRSNEPGFPDELRPLIDSLIYTYRPNLVTAILTLDRLPSLEAENEARRQNVALFKRHLDGVSSLAFPVYDDEDECVFHMLTANFDPQAAGVSRDAYLTALVAEGVPAIAYVFRGLHHSARLSPDWAGPRVMWTETLRKAGADPTTTSLPGCDEKVARAIEFPWNYVTVDEVHMKRLADAVVKVEENLDELREYERREGGVVAAPK